MSGMFEVKVTSITGFKELNERLKQLPKKLADGGKRIVVKKQIKEWLGEVQQRAPIGPTRNLKGSFKPRVTGSGDFVRGSVVSYAPHAHLVEFGHKKVLWGHSTNERVPAHPFMRPTLDSQWERTQDSVADDFSRLLDAWEKA